MHAWGLRLRRVLQTLALPCPPMLPSALLNCVGTLVAIISQLDTQPACAPVNASRPVLRLATHDSGTGWLATPFLYGSFIHDSKPVYPGALSSLLVDLATGAVPHAKLPIRVPSGESAHTDLRKPIQGQASFSLRDPAAALRESFEHRDAKRRFRLINNLEELEQALEAPWEKWTVFLHPAQRELVERDFNGPARVSGSAGTGKTIVALHRVVYLARKNPDARLLLSTFSDPLRTRSGQNCGT